MSKSTIAAISTALVSGGLSVIRMSGEKSISIADKIFKSENGKVPSNMKGYTCAYGHIVFDDEIIDECVLTVFRNPKSYTGEDLVEISCHGGVYVTQRVLRCCLLCGANLAEPGEFTKRAFLNGKMDLTRAEAVIDIISANSENELKYANSLREGALSRRIDVISDKLTVILGDLAAWADFPEEDLPELETDVMINNLDAVLADITQLCSTYDYGKIVREGIETVIVGKPNVGKSTLMNSLSGFERSIVSEFAGTTRDAVEESIRFGDVVLNLCDTAGMHDTQDYVEGVGVKIAEKKLENAELVLAVFDYSRNLDDEDNELLCKIMNKNTIIIINKTDCEKALDTEILSDKFENIVEISAANNSGIDELQNLIEKMFLNNEISFSNGVIANQRQWICAQNAKLAVENAKNAAESGLTLDIVTVLIEEAAGEIANLKGESLSENVVNEVFSRFCVGK